MRQSGLTPVISVIVPALNEEAVIGQCLTSLQQQKLPADRFEVIVVDNGSTDHTREIARSFRGWLRLTILERRGVRISALRNLGASVARGRFLAFLDADCVAPAHWLLADCGSAARGRVTDRGRPIPDTGRLVMGGARLVWRFMAYERRSGLLCAGRRPSHRP